MAAPSLLFAAMFFGEGFPVDLGSDFEFCKPIRPGDVITTVTEFADIQDRSGEKGRCAFMAFKSTHKNQKGEVVAISTSRIMSFG